LLLVAYVEAIKSDKDMDVEVIFDNLFPSIWFRAGILIKYTGSIPGKIKSINYVYNSENDWIDALVSSGDFYINIKDSYENIVELEHQLHKNDEIVVEFWIHIPQEQDLMNLSGYFTATFEISQWNEVTSSDDENDGEPLDVSNYLLYQTSSDLNYNIPEGNSVDPGGYIIIARDSEKENFESYWEIVLPSNVVFINSDNNFPSINGDETFELYDNNGIIVDGPTGQPMIAYHTIQRLNTTYDPTQLDSWSVNSDSFATPGSDAIGDGTAGLIINEYSDASGTGNWRYEYVELYYDAIIT
jgi:hypothetical protein